jgi:hypothetical protein
VRKKHLGCVLDLVRNAKVFQVFQREIPAGRLGAQFDADNGYVPALKKETSSLTPLSPQVMTHGKARSEIYVRSLSTLPKIHKA